MAKTISEAMQHKLDNFLQQGYSEYYKGNEAAACDLWNEAWRSILLLFETEGFQSIEEVDKAFIERHAILNWAPDFDEGLWNAGREDKRYIQLRLEFCRDYVRMTEAKDDRNTLNMRRSIADCLFELGRIDEGEQVYQQLLKEYPKFGWGWVGWSDQYWFFCKPDRADSDKAMDILKEALTVSDLEDRWDVVDRLRAIYKHFDMYDEADALGYPEEDSSTKMFKAGMLKAAADANQIFQQLNNKQPFIRGEKIGRNDPCPCGSGKKYKKCCGK